MQAAITALHKTHRLGTRDQSQRTQASVYCGQNLKKKDGQGGDGLAEELTDGSPTKAG